MLDQRERKRWRHLWPLWARSAQCPPPGDWQTWLILAGRGFGKTRAGAEWVQAVAAHDGAARIALVAASLGEARAIMVEGESGLRRIAPPGQQPHYESSLRRLTWPSGAQATLYSAAEPDSLRGPEASHAWADEVGKWDPCAGRAMAAWDNLMMGLRLGDQPRVVVTTTPRDRPLVRHLVAAAGDEAPGAAATVVTRGTTFDNCANLPRAYLHAMRRSYGASQLGRQELYGDLLLDRAGALWTRALLETARESGAVPAAARTVIGVDPPASAGGDACGIVVCALGADGVARVLADASAERASPERWARAVAAAAALWQADRVVAEANQGGAMVASVLRAADCALPLQLVHARTGKAARAEPVAALYEAGRVRHAGLFAVLEDQLCGLLAGGGYAGPGRSPDRADALVWALTDLCLSYRSIPRVLAL
ncbi:DNA-packaging protein [Novosphingobium piscinae]|uniref:DNA-packaging protein n=1 Tax=Novosphingobium piscinae TaxID=1507448 RepID=A0A7X1G0W9_9SPHN|nr:terminase family protein [Novosphingobium piscinae]MBC2670516.1 DNA-packaging protein [Novosphingobium piscinae]